MKELDSSYLITEFDTAIIRLVSSSDGSATILGKFHAILTWAQQEQSKYYDVYYVPKTSGSQTQYVPAIFFYPEYYRCLYVKLYNFDGKAVTDGQPWVIVYDTDDQGHRFVNATDSKQFDSYQEAVDYMNSLTSGNHVIVGINPFVSPVPLEAVPDFQLIHSSTQGTSVASAGFESEIKIFQYTGNNK